MDIKKYNYKGYDIIEVIKNSEHCTIILSTKDECYDLVTSYCGEYDEQVIDELLLKR